MSAAGSGRRRIGINVSWMSPGQAGGMEWYVRNLVAALGRLDQQHDYVLVTSPDNWATFALPSPRWTKIAYAGPENTPQAFAVLPGRAADAGDWSRHLYDRLRHPRRRCWRRGLNDLIARERLDLWFCPLIYLLPLDSEIPVVVTIPDLQHEHFPEFFPAGELALRTMGYAYSARRAAATIAISEFVAGDLVARYGLDPGRTFAMPLAVDPTYAVTPAAGARLVDEVRGKYRLDHDFIYYPANGWRHKNHDTLIRAHRILRAKGRDLHLVLTGCPFDLMDRLRPLFEGPAEAAIVRHLGYVTRRDTIGLYAAASAVVFPSLFEGFGFPLLEAMQVGTPVVCFPVGSLPEVGGDAVVYAEPRDAEGLAEAALRVLDDDHLRQRLVAAGRARVGTFSFAETARRTLALFENVLAGTLPPPALPPFRPLIAHRWLREGHSRWYFHWPRLRGVRLTVAQPTTLPALAGQVVTVTLDGRTVLEEVLEPERDYTFTVTAPTPAATDFHRLEARAARTAHIDGEVLSLMVRALTLLRDDGTELDLIR